VTDATANAIVNASYFSALDAATPVVPAAVEATPTFTG
jgi:hypothetical protein